MRAYLRAMVTELASQGQQHQIIVFTPAWAESLLDIDPPNVTMVRLRGVPKDKFARVVYQQTVLPAVAVRHDVDVFFATATVAPLLCPMPVVLSVQFLQFFKWNDVCGPLRTHYLKAMLRLSVRKARRSITFTRAAGEELIQFTGVPPDRVRIVPHGLSERLLNPDDASMSLDFHDVAKAPYVVYVSALYAYKNHHRLIRAFGSAKRRAGLPHRLVIIGSEEAVSHAELRATAAAAGVVDDVLFLGRVPSIDRAYRGAAAAVFPTLSETFGYPLLEAMAVGCPVVASAISAVAELAGDAAELVDPYDETSMARGIERVLTDEAHRAQLIRSGRERAQRFTWHRSGQATLAAIEEAASA